MTLELIREITSQANYEPSDYSDGIGITSLENPNIDWKNIYLIDKLWLKYSSGNFGFKVQEEIYSTTDTAIDKTYYDLNELIKFFIKVNWSERDFTKSETIRHKQTEEIFKN